LLVTPAQAHSAAAAPDTRRRLPNQTLRFTLRLALTLTARAHRKNHDVAASNLFLFAAIVCEKVPVIGIFATSLRQMPVERLARLDLTLFGRMWMWWE